MTPEEREEYYNKVNPPMTHWRVHLLGEEIAIEYPEESFAKALERIADEIFPGQNIYTMPSPLTDFDRKEHGYKLDKWAIYKSSGEVLGFIYKIIWRHAMGV